MKFAHPDVNGQRVVELVNQQLSYATLKYVESKAIGEQAETKGEENINEESFAIVKYTKMLVEQAEQRLQGAHKMRSLEIGGWPTPLPILATLACPPYLCPFEAAKCP